MVIASSGVVFPPCWVRGGLLPEGEGPDTAAGGGSERWKSLGATLTTLGGGVTLFVGPLEASKWRVGSVPMGSWMCGRGLSALVLGRSFASGRSKFVFQTKTYKRGELLEASGGSTSLLLAHQLQLMQNTRLLERKPHPWEGPCGHEVCSKVVPQSDRRSVRR